MGGRYAGRRIAVTACTGIDLVSVVDHGGVVPVRLGVSTAGSAVLEPVAMAVNAGTGSSLDTITVGIAAEGCQQCRGAGTANTDTDCGSRCLSESQGLGIEAVALHVSSIKWI